LRRPAALTSIALALEELVLAPGASAQERERTEIDNDEVGGNHQTVTGGGEIFDEFIRSPLIERSASLVFCRSS
jgi:hypothetical protein